MFSEYDADETVEAPSHGMSMFANWKEPLYNRCDNARNSSRN